DQVGRQFRQAVIVIVRKAAFDRDVAVFDETGFAQTFAKCRQLICDRLGRGGSEKSDHRHRGLLRTRHEPPCDRCPAPKGDELAPSHSMASSARSSRIDWGTVRPSALAVLRLTTISIFVGSCTGRSPGFAPRRMRST